uniref:Uncharacterized protein n=1 Tax=Arundo donax TaxID=35708 RepID=A0A0A8Y9Q9_ARUDO
MKFYYSKSSISYRPWQGCLNPMR